MEVWISERLWCYFGLFDISSAAGACIGLLMLPEWVEFSLAGLPDISWWRRGIQKPFYWYPPATQVSLSQGGESQFHGDKVASGTRLLGTGLLTVTGLFLIPPVSCSVSAGEEKSPGLRNKETSPAGPPAFPGFLVLVPPTHLSIFPWKRGFSGPAEKNGFPIFGRAASWSPLHEVVRGTPSRSKGKNELLGYLLLLGGKSENARSGWPPYVDWGMQDDLPALFLWSWVPKPACFLLSIL